MTAPVSSSQRKAPPRVDTRKVCGRWWEREWESTLVAIELKNDAARHVKRETESDKEKEINVKQRYE